MSRKQSKAERDEARKKEAEAAYADHGRGANSGAIRVNKDTFKTFKRLMSYFGKKNILKLLIVFVCIIVTARVSVRSSTFLETLIDDYIKPLLLMPKPDFSGLIMALLQLAGLYSISIVVGLIYRLIMTGVSNGVLLDIRKDLFNHMQTLPVSYFDTHQYGDLMSRYTNDVDSIRQLMSESITEVFSGLVTIVSLFIAMIKLSLPLTCIVIGNIILMYIVTITIGTASAKNSRLRQQAIGDMNAFVEENLNGLKVIKVFCHENKSMEVFNKTNNNLCEKGTKADMYGSIIMPIMSNLGNVQYVVIAIVGAWLALSGRASITLGMLVAFLTLSRNFNRPMSLISQQINSFISALVGARRVFDVIDAPSEEDNGYVTLVNVVEKEDGTLEETDHRTDVWAWKHPHEDGSIEYVRVRGDVEMHDVDFGYVPDVTVLHDISLYAKPGQKIAFVGSTGAGKTTITNLLNRFYDIDDGKIRFDGININKIKKADLRRSLGMVLQETNLFTGTIADNIRYGKPDATMEEVIAAAKLANADSFIKKLPNGYDTVISGTGSELSQGQCQLLSIARCAIADPPVMILDEATSSVDTRTEILIQQGMDRLMAGRTTFVIAHRLSTVQNSDAIMVVEGGRIIERGDHDELIAQEGRYYQLYTGNAAKVAAAN